MFILVRQTICGAMLIRVGKLQFIGLIGGRVFNPRQQQVVIYLFIGAKRL